MKYDDRGVADLLAHKPDSSVRTAKGSIAQRPRMQFTIGYFMIAIVFVAHLLAIPAVFYLIATIVSAPFLSMFAARWLLARRQRRLAAFSFWVAATSINFYVAHFCIVPNINSPAFKLILPGLFLAIPTIGALGTTWALLLSRDEAISPRAARPPGTSVLLMTLLPIVTLWTFWPLRVAFLLARPSIEQSGESGLRRSLVRFPQRAGVFDVVRPAIEPVSHYVGLRIDTTWPPTGFVLLPPGATPKATARFVGKLRCLLGRRMVVPGVAMQLNIRYPESLPRPNPRAPGTDSGRGASPL